MKTLYLVRHAESSSQNSSLADHDRSLNKRGEEEASHMGKRLEGRRPKPEVIISSPAVRAKSTARILAMAIRYPESAIRFDNRIYEADPEDLVSMIHDLDDTSDCMMLVGHNPALTQLVQSLVQCDCANMPTCSVAVLRFSTDLWDDIGRIKGELLDFDYPKKIAE